MASKEQRLAEVIEKEMPGSRIVKPKRAADAVPNLPADAVTPNLDAMRKKYKMGARPERAAAPAGATKTGKSQMVVVESNDASSADAPAKRMTVVVRDGKIRARQG